MNYKNLYNNDRYKDNYYARQSGNYFPPIEIDVSANITKPHLDFHISKFDKTFVCCASKVMQTRRKRLEYVKLQNTNPFNSKDIIKFFI